MLCCDVGLVKYLSITANEWFGRWQRSTRVSKKSRSRQLLPSLRKSRSRKTLNYSLGKVSVSIDLKICSLEKSRSRRNRKFESRKSLSLDNFHWIVSEITKFRKTNSKGCLWQLYSSLNLGWWLILTLFHLIMTPSLTHVIWSILSQNRILLTNPKSKSKVQVQV